MLLLGVTPQPSFRSLNLVLVWLRRWSRVLLCCQQKFWEFRISSSEWWVEGILWSLLKLSFFTTIIQFPGIEWSPVDKKCLSKNPTGSWNNNSDGTSSSRSETWEFTSLWKLNINHQICPRKEWSKVLSNFKTYRYPKILISGTIRPVTIQITNGSEGSQLFGLLLVPRPVNTTTTIQSTIIRERKKNSAHFIPHNFWCFENSKFFF